MKLEEVISIKLGLNISRQKNKEDLDVYSNDDLNNDLCGTDEKNNLSKERDEKNSHVIKEGDIVYSFINSLSTIVGSNNSGKVINQNFAKINIDSDMIDGKFLCYLLNQNQDIEKQKFISMQGSSIRKLSPATIREFEVILPDIDHQKRIGALYFDWMARQALVKKRLELEEMAFMELLNKLTIIDEGEKNGK